MSGTSLAANILRLKWPRRNLPRFFEAVKKQNEQVKMREYEMEEEGRTTPAEKAQDTELRALQEVRPTLASFVCR